jgi:hypothetical protein
MTIQTDIITALASVASGKVYPEAAPEDVAVPLVIYRRIAHEPLMTLQGYSGSTRSSFVFECWATTKQGALTLAASVITAIDAASPLTTKYRENVSGEDYESQYDQFVEPVQYSFWHA